VTLPRHRVTARPLPIGLRADLECHPNAVAGVVARAAHLRHVPARTEVAGTPFAICLKAAAGQDDRPAADILLDAVNEGADSFNAVFAPQDGLRARTVTHCYAMLGRCLVFCFDEACAATIGIDDNATEEFELAFVVIGLPAVVREETHTA